MKNDRGKLLHQGKTGMSGDTINSQIQINLTLLIIASIFLTIFISSFYISFTAGDSSPGYLLKIMSIFMSSLLFYYFIMGGGLEIDGIFQNGITLQTPSLIAKLRGRTFHCYSDISLIYYGRTETRNGQTNYLRIVGLYLPDRRKASDFICENLYENDYYERMWNALEKNCSNVEWIEENRI